MNFLSHYWDSKENYKPPIASIILVSLITKAAKIKLIARYQKILVDG